MHAWKSGDGDCDDDIRGLVKNLDGSLAVDECREKMEDGFNLCRKGIEWR